MSKLVKTFDLEGMYANEAWFSVIGESALGYTTNKNILGYYISSTIISYLTDKKVFGVEYTQRFYFLKHNDWTRLKSIHGNLEIITYVSLTTNGHISLNNTMVYFGNDLVFEEAHYEN